MTAKNSAEDIRNAPIPSARGSGMIVSWVSVIFELAARTIDKPTTSSILLNAV
jgi:hypothetical protein